MKLINFRKSKNKWLNKVIFIFLLLVLIFIILNLVKSLQKKNQITEEITLLQNEIQNLEKQNLELKELIEYFNSDAYIEERARISLGLKKQGEKVIILPEARGGKENEYKTGEKNVLAKTNPQKWWDYFFK